MDAGACQAVALDAAHAFYIDGPYALLSVAVLVAELVMSGNVVMAARCPLCKLLAVAARCALAHVIAAALSASAFAGTMSMLCDLWHVDLAYAGVAALVGHLCLAVGAVCVGARHSNIGETWLWWTTGPVVACAALIAAFATATLLLWLPPALSALLVAALAAAARRGARRAARVDDIEAAHDAK